MSRPRFPSLLGSLAWLLFAPGLAAQTKAIGDTPFTYAGISIAPGVSYSYEYQIGAQSAPGFASSGAVQVVGVDLTGTAGRHWTFHYAPVWTLYSSSAFSDTVNQTAEIAAAYVYDDWAMNLAEDLTDTDLPSIETGAQTKQRSWRTAFGAGRQLSDQFKVQASATTVIESAAVRYSQGREWDGSGSLLYQATRDLDFGGTLAATYSTVLGGIQLLDLSPQLQLNWKANEHDSVSAHAGLSDEIVLRGPIKGSRGPSAGLSATKTTDAGTTLSLDASRAQELSFLTNQLTTSSVGRLSLGRTFASHYFYSADFSKSWTNYQGSGTPGNALFVTADRRDRSTTADLNVGLRGLFKRGTLSVGYSYTRVISSIAAFSQTPRIWTAQFSYHY